MASWGFGLGIGVRDEGASTAIHNAQKGLDALNDKMEQQGKTAKKTGGFVSNMLKGIQAFQLGAISAQLDKVLNSGDRMTNSLEANFVTMRAAAKPFTVQMGLMGKEANQAESQMVSLAHSMNVGPESVGKAMVAMNTQGQKLAPLFKTMKVGAKDLVMMEKSLGVESGNMVSVWGDLSQSWQMSDVQIKKLMNDLAKTSVAGRTTGVAFKDLSKTTDILNKNFEKSGKSVSPERIAELVLETNKLAGAFTRMGDDQATAMGKARDVLNALTSEQVAQDNMLEGMGGKYGDIFSGMVKASGKFQSVSQIFALGPMEATREFIKLRKHIEATQPAAMLSKFDQSLAKVSTGLKFAVADAKGTTQALDDVEAAAASSTATLKKLTKQGFHDGRTAAQKYNLISEHVVKNFRAINDKDAGKFLQAQRKGARDFTKEMRELSKQKGPMGEFVRRASMVSEFGLAGFFHETGKEASKMSIGIQMGSKVLGEMMAPLAPIIGLIGPLVPAIGALAAGLFSLPGAALVAVGAFILFPEKIAEGIEAGVDWLSGNEAESKLGKGFENVMAGGWNWAIDKLGSMKDAGIKIANKIASADWSSIRDSLKQKFSDFMSGKKMRLHAPEPPDFSKIKKGGGRWNKARKEYKSALSAFNEQAAKDAIGKAPGEGPGLSGAAQAMFSVEGMVSMGETAARNIGEGIIAFFASGAFTSALEGVIAAGGRLAVALFEGVHKEIKAQGDIGGIMGKFFTESPGENALVDVGRVMLGFWLGKKALKSMKPGGLLSSITGQKEKCMPVCGGGGDSGSGDLFDTSRGKDRTGKSSGKRQPSSRRRRVRKGGKIRRGIDAIKRLANWDVGKGAKNVASKAGGAVRGVASKVGGGLARAGGGLLRAGGGVASKALGVLGGPAAALLGAAYTGYEIGSFIDEHTDMSGKAAKLFENTDAADAASAKSKKNVSAANAKIAKSKKEFESRQKAIKSGNGQLNKTVAASVAKSSETMISGMSKLKTEFVTLMGEMGAVGGNEFATSIQSSLKLTFDAIAKTLTGRSSDLIRQYHEDITGSKATGAIVDAIGASTFRVDSKSDFLMFPDVSTFLIVSAITKMSETLHKPLKSMDETLSSLVEKDGGENSSGPARLRVLSS